MYTVCSLFGTSIEKNEFESANTFNNFCLRKFAVPEQVGGRDLRKKYSGSGTEKKTICRLM
jgi:hypothetical protein